MHTVIREFPKGILKENPLLVLSLGLCPALAVSTQVANALGMGAGVLFVMLGSNIAVAALKNVIPHEIHIPAYIVIIASFVTVVDLLMQAYAPALSKNLGVFVPLIVVNCVILGRAEAFASKKSVKDAIEDALGMGLGFTLGLTIIALIREVLGAGTITLFPLGGFDGKIDIPILHRAPVRVLTLPAGALFVVGYLRAFFNWMTAKKRKQGARQ